MSSNSTENTPNSNLERSECIRLIQLVLDDEATPEQKEIFEKEVCNCMPYFKIYEVDKAVKALVKKSCCGKDMPSTLADEIKSKLFLKS